MIPTANKGLSKLAGTVIDANFARIAGFQTLVDAATIAFDISKGGNAKVTLAGSRTMGAPTNATPGESGKLTFIQDGTGSRLITWNSAWKHAGGTDLVLSTAANAVDTIEWYTPDGTTFQIVSAVKGLDT